MKVLPSFCVSQIGTRREPDRAEFSGFFAMQKSH